MARPNARSSHRQSVPQGGGAPVVVATLALAWAAAASTDPGTAVPMLAAVSAAAALLCVIGAMDDIRPLPVLPRLAGQFLAVGLVVGLAPAGWIVFGGWLPVSVERALLVIAGVWFVNLTNFIDGIDGITLADFLPLAMGAVVLGASGHLSSSGLTLAAAFLGGLAGFVWFNWPQARLFLGDVGSLPIGLLGGALAFDLASHGAVAAAILLPLYPFTDATLTLFNRWRKGERVWQAHRAHAYQRAVDRGWSHGKTSGAVLALNLALALAAWLSPAMSQSGQLLLIIAAIAGVLAFMRLIKGAPLRG
jgi:UDP-N-acetylmuramyl pentapeptide phosphotransferase/UDP-N-acetylglucosamine-1-phosphate transferase